MNEIITVLQVGFDTSSKEFILQADKKLSLTDYLKIQNMLNEQIQLINIEREELNLRIINDLNTKMDTVLKSNALTLTALKDILAGTNETTNID